jgi:hypothetical protein
MVDDAMETAIKSNANRPASRMRIRLGRLIQLSLLIFHWLIWLHAYIIRHIQLLAIGEWMNIHDKTKADRQKWGFQDNNESI